MSHESDYQGGYRWVMHQLCHENSTPEEMRNEFDINTLFGRGADMALLHYNQEPVLRVPTEVPEIPKMFLSPNVTEK